MKNQYRIKFSVPSLSEKTEHVILIVDDSLADTWSHVNIEGTVYDLNVWYDESPIQAVLYPTFVTKEGTFITDHAKSLKVVLHGIRSTKTLDLAKVRYAFSDPLEENYEPADYDCEDVSLRTGYHNRRQ